MGGIFEAAFSAVAETVRAEGVELVEENPRMLVDVDPVQGTRHPLR